MEKLNGAGLTAQAGRSLEGKDSRKLAVFHTGITVGIALVISLLQYVVTQGIGNTSGLSGLGTRSILQTVQTVLQWGNIVLMPFWMLGFTYAAMRWARGEYARKEDLLAGFRRFLPYLGLMLNRALLTISVLIICVNISSILFMLTPAAADVTAMVGNMDMEQTYAYMYAMDAEQQAQLLQSMIPVFIIWGVLSVAILVPLLYRFRMAEYAILNQPGVRAMPAMLISATLLRRRCWQLFKLDLRLWWYYALELLCNLLCYGDILLALAGVTLPVAGEVMFFVSYGLYLAALFCVRAVFLPRVQTTYALAYEALLQMKPVPRKVQTKPQNVPWDEE